MQQNRTSMNLKRSAGRTRRRLLFQSLDERRVLASITGLVFEDANDSLGLSNGERGVEQRLVYLDSNANGTLDDGETSQLTDSGGGFQFLNLPVGDYRVALANGASSQVQTSPTSGSVSNVFSVTGTDPVGPVLTSESIAGAVGRIGGRSRGTDPIDRR